MHVRARLDLGTSLLRTVREGYLCRAKRQASHTGYIHDMGSRHESLEGKASMLLVLGSPFTEENTPPLELPLLSQKGMHKYFLRW